MTSTFSNNDLDVDFEAVSNQSLHDLLQSITAVPHIGGAFQDKIVAEWIKDKFVEFGLDYAEVRYWFRIKSVAWSVSRISTAVSTVKYCKVEKILKGSLNSISSPSLKIQIMGGKVCLRCEDKTLLDIVNQGEELWTGGLWSVSAKKWLVWQFTAVFKTLN